RHERRARGEDRPDPAGAVPPAVVEARHALQLVQLAVQGQQLRHIRGRGELSGQLHRITFTFSALSPRSSRSTRSGGSNESSTAALSPTASWIAALIACSGAPPPSPMPLAPIGVNADGLTTFA